MKKMLLETKTSIATYISNGGLKVTIVSPEIGGLIKGGDDIVQTFWHRREEIESITGSSGTSFETLVKYFLTTSESHKKALYQQIMHKNFWHNVLRYIKDKHVRNLVSFPHDITISQDGYIYRKQTLNLMCLTDPQIIEGKSFLYKGIFNKEMVSTSIAPLLRLYASGIIKTFGLTQKKS